MPVSAPDDARFIEVSGLRLRVASLGEGPPLLVITGLGANIEMWGAFRRRLVGSTVIAFDAPGMGRSSLPRRPLRMPELADVAAGVISELGYDTVDVLGYSLGGGIAQELARRHPDRVARLILCATGPGLGGLPPRNLLIPLILSTPYRYYSPRHLATVTPILAGGRTARDKEAQRAQVEIRRVNRPGWIAYIFQVFAGSTWTSLPWLHRLEQPTLVIAGDDDPIMPVFNARLLARRIPNARLHVLPGAGHLFLLDEPESAIAPIQAFLGRDAEDVGQ